MMRQLLSGSILIGLALALVPTASAEEPVSTKEIQIWKKGKELREFDLTAMGPGARGELEKQMRDLGFAPHELRVLKSFADGRIESVINHYGAKPQASTPGSGKPESDIDRDALEQDIRELLKRKGRFPKDYVPHGSTPAPAPVLRLGEPDYPSPEASRGFQALAPSLGKLLLRYLELKDDPHKGPIYEQVLRDLALDLEAAPKQGTALVGARLRERLMAPSEDVRTAAIHREILELVAEGLPAPRLPTPARAAPRSPTGSAGPRLGGATLEPTVRLSIGGPGPSVDTQGDPVLRVTAVPKGSLADRMGLAVGDRILRLDHKAPTPAVLLAAEEILRKKGQLHLRIRRKNGDTDVELDLGER